MTEREWHQVVAVIAANWPHKPPPDESIEKWHRDLADLPGEQVLVAVEALYREGREFPPNGAQIRAKVAELRADDMSEGGAWELVMRAVRRFGHMNEEGALEWLGGEAPTVAEALRRFGYRDFCLWEGEHSHLRAQFRDVYKSTVRERARDAVYAGLPDAGLRRLQRGPRHIGEALKQITEGVK